MWRLYWAGRQASAPQHGRCPVRGFVWFVTTQACLLPLNHFKNQLRSTFTRYPEAEDSLWLEGRVWYEVAVPSPSTGEHR